MEETNTGSVDVTVAPPTPATGESPEITRLKEQLAFMHAENRRLQDLRTRGISLKVSEKGALSVYGLGRFPVTLYKSQWMRLIENIPSVAEYIGAHPELKEKGE